MNDNILERFDGYVDNLYFAYSAFDESAYFRSLGTLRGFVHGLSMCLKIPPSCEHSICCVDPFGTESIEVFMDMVRSMLRQGLVDFENRCFSETDFALAQVMGLELPGVKESTSADKKC